MPVQDGDLATIRQPLDFYGFNYYNPMRISARRGGRRGAVRAGRRSPATRRPTSAGPIVPDGMRQVIGQLVERYPDIPPIYITENGCSYRDGSRRDGRRRRPAAHRLPRRPPARRGRRHRRRRRRTRLLLLVADGQLRVGRAATPSGSGWCTSTTTPWCARPKRSFEWYAELIAAQRVSNPIAGSLPDRPTSPRSPSRRRPVSAVWVLWLSLISIGVWSGFFGPIQVLLAQQAEAISPDHKEAVALAGHASSARAVSMVLNPLWGAFSDRTDAAHGPAAALGARRTRSAASSRWCVLSQAPTRCSMMVLGWCVAQAGLNAMLAAITATVPDQVPSPSARCRRWLAGDRPDDRASSPGSGIAATRPAASRRATSTTAGVLVLCSLPYCLDSRDIALDPEDREPFELGRVRALVLGLAAGLPRLRVGLDHPVPDEPRQRAGAPLPPLLPQGRGRPDRRSEAEHGVFLLTVVYGVCIVRHGGPRRHLVRPTRAGARSS